MAERTANGTQAQARAYAQRAREKAQQRREQASGAAGWVADRAGQWELREPSPALMNVTKYLWNPLMDFYFRMEIEGWERIPEPPALLIGIHSGAPFVWDAWTVGVQWWRHFGPERPLHGTAHDALMASPVIGAFFRRMGVLPGGPDSMPVLWSGRKLAQLMQLDKIARLKVFPIALSAPWGIGPAALPEIPLPTKIRTAFQEPVTFDDDPERANDDAYVDAKYEE